MKSNLQKPVHFSGALDMPYATFSVASMMWNATGSWRYLRPGYVRQIPACQAGCPAAEPIELWLRHFESGDIEKAWSALTTENPFPGLMGRVCFHPCEKNCNRKDVGGTVTINMLERFLADEFGYKKISLKPWRPQSGRKIAVIGSGPAGLSCAYFSAMLGHKVTVFEKSAKPGGLFRYGIPQYRLPKEIVEKEIKKLYDIGIDFQCGRALSNNEISALAEKFDAAFVATGAHASQQLGIEGENSKGVLSALAFLENVQLNAEGAVSSLCEAANQAAVIIGGGNSAIDAARTAVRLGAKSVTVLYRRSRTEMPAFEDEVNDAVVEGVKLEILSAPLKIAVKNGRVEAVVCTKMELGIPDESGRRRPVPVKNSEFTVPADLVLVAIGEVPEKNLPEKNKKVYPGGDLTNTSRTVVDAVGSGKLAAIEIDCMLNGKNFKEVFDKIRVPETNAVRMAEYLGLGDHLPGESCTNKVVRTEHLNTYYFDRSEPASCPKVPANERRSNFAEVHRTPDGKTAQAQAERCMHCGHCTNCDNCYIYCPDVSILKNKQGYDIDLDFCKGCGICVKECPRAAMKMSEEL